MNIASYLSQLDSYECNNDFEVQPLFGEDLLNELDLIEAQQMLTLNTLDYEI